MFCDNLTYNGPYHSDGDLQWIDTVTTISILTDEGEDLCAGMNNTFYKNHWLTGGDEEYCESICDEWEPSSHSDPGWEAYMGPFSGGEESCHVIEYHSVFGPCNKSEVKWDCVYVDKTPPFISKRLGKPVFIEDSVKWITSDTPIYADVYDPEPHPSGVAEVSYRITLLVDDEMCRDEILCESAEGSCNWNDYEDMPFYIGEDSCHLIEIMAVDNVGKASMHKQCVFVDNQAPLPNKTVGEPKIEWDGSDAHFYDIEERCWNESGDFIECWKVTLLTPITLNCTDPEPHPVNHESLCFKLDLDGDDNTERYCEEYGGEFNTSGDGTCCIGDETFYFLEESEHNLQYYCVDALGNKGPIDDEKFKVEGNVFEIQINKKWNLISVPFMMLDNSIGEVFKDIADDVESVWTYDAETGEWYVYSPGPATDTLTEMEPGWGYWVLSYNDTTLLIGGSLFRPIETFPSKKIVPGWNLIGYWGTEGQELYNGPYGNGETSECALYSFGEDLWDKPFISLWTYWEPWNAVAEKAPDYQWVPHGKDDRMDPGAGYWVYTAQNIDYVHQTVCND